MVLLLFFSFKLRRGISSNGRAIALHAIGNGIDARILQIGNFSFFSSPDLFLHLQRASKIVHVCTLPFAFFYWTGILRRNIFAHQPFP